MRSLASVSTIAGILIGFFSISPLFDAKSAISGSGTTENILRVETDAGFGASVFEVTRSGSGELESMTYRSTEGTAVYTLEQLRARPAVLVRSGGYDVVTLSLEPGFTAEKGGFLMIRYLQNGITKAYGSYRLLLDVQDRLILRTGDSNDEDPRSSRYSGLVRKLIMKKRTIMGQLVGIREVVALAH